MDQFRQIIDTDSVLTDADWSQVTETVQLVSLNQGDSCGLFSGVDPMLGLVKSGFLKQSYTRENGRCYTIELYKAGSFIGNYDEILSSERIENTITPLTDTVLLAWKYSDLDRLFDSTPSFQKFARKITEFIFIRSETRLKQLLIYDAQERYEEFLKTFPELVGIVKDYEVAAYLGITPVSLSRIKKKF